MGLSFVILIGLIGGAAVGLQSPLSAAMGTRVGGIASSFIVHLSGMLLSAVFLFFRGGERIRDWNTLPWYMLCAGFLGLVLISTITVTLPRLGGTMMIVLILIGQLLAGMIIDHFGLLGVPVRPIDLARVLGVLALVVGAYLIAR